jgi:hypothetical protein
MKLLKSVLSVVLLTLALALPSSLLAQSGPPAPNTGIWAIIDTTYTVGSTTIGQTKARITFNRTSGTSLVTGTQFRVFYDKNAFSSCNVSLVGSNTNLYLQSVDNNASGFVTITLVYTGNSSTYTLPNAETFELNFTHVTSATFNSLATIGNLTWTATPPSMSFPAYAATQAGIDSDLSLHSYGGRFVRPALRYHGRFTNVTGTGAKNLTVVLEKRPKLSSTWTKVNSYATDINGRFSLNETIDTTYFDVRLAVKGDTMNVGNVISTADAQLINQWVLGSSAPSGFDFYTGDVNGSNNLTITDAYGVFGRIAGRFTTWPNSVKDVKFFTTSEYNTINSNPSNNYTSTISGVTNFYYNILPGQPDSVTYYVCVTGDANRTGFHMARLTPIQVITNPQPGTPAATQNIIDMNVKYDFPTTSMEVSLPSLSVNGGNLVEVPVTIKTNGEQISALQLGLMYDQNVLEFKDLKNSEQAMFWMSYINPMEGIVEWGGYDPSANKSYMISDRTQLFTLRFTAKQPQSDWTTSPLYTTEKFSGNENSKDMNITPTNGILVVYRMASVNNDQLMVVYPNPTTGEFAVKFNVEQDGLVKLYVINQMGEKIDVIINKNMKKGSYEYNSNISNVSDGVYAAILNGKNQVESTKIIKK